MPVEVSLRIMDSDIARGMGCSFKDEGEDQRRMMSWSVSCAAAMALKSRMGGESLLSSALVSILERVSAGVLALPLTCLMSER